MSSGKLKGTEFRNEFIKSLNVLAPRIAASIERYGDKTVDVVNLVSTGTADFNNIGVTGTANFDELNISSDNTTTDVVDITADSVTTAKVIDVTADALTTGGILNLVSDSADTSARTLVTVKNDNTAAVGTVVMHLVNDAIGGFDDPILLIESTANETHPVLELKNSNASTTGEPILLFTRSDSSAEADDMSLGTLIFRGVDAGNNNEYYAQIKAFATDVTTGDEGGLITFLVKANGTAGTAGNKTLFSIGGEDVANTVVPSVVVNEDGINCDFRVEGDTETHLIFADGSADRVSIGASTDSPAATFEVTNANDGGVPLVQLNSNDTDKIAIDVNAANIDAHVVDITADALTTAGMLNLVSDSSNTSARALATIHNDNTAAVGATGLYIKNDAVASTAKQTVLIETTVASEDNPLLRLKNSNADANGPILRFENSAGADGSDDDFVGTISFSGEDDGTPTDVEYAKIAAQATDVSSGAKNGTVAFTAMVANAAREVARMNPESSTAGTFCGGFGYRRPVIEVTDATYVLTADQSGVILALNRPAGITVTLPADTNTGFHCKMVVLDTFTGTWKVATESDGDLLLGGISIVSAAAKADSFGSNGSSHDTMTMSSDQKGRFKGGSVEFTSVAADKWLVSGVLNGGGTPVNPFTNS